MQFPINPIFERCLIEAVKAQPVLYDKMAIGYNSKQRNDKAWDQVFAEVNKRIKNVNVTHCRLRWRSLRDRYVKQFMKAPNGQLLSPGAGKWEYNAQLSFLDVHLRKRKFTSIEKVEQNKRTHTNISNKIVIVKEPLKQNPIRRYNVSETSMHGSYNNYSEIPFEDDETEDMEEFIDEEKTEKIEFVTLNSRSESTSLENSSPKTTTEIIEIEEAEVVEEDSVTNIESIQIAPLKRKRTSTEFSKILPTQNTTEILKIDRLQPTAETMEISGIEFVPIQQARNSIDSVEESLSSETTLLTTEDVVNDDPLPISDTRRDVHTNTINSTEECINNLLHTINKLLAQQQKNDAKRSENESYFQVLENLFSKLPPNEIDGVKVDILNLIMNKKKFLERTR